MTIEWATMQYWLHVDYFKYVKRQNLCPDTFNAKSRPLPVAIASFQIFIPIIIHRRFPPLYYQYNG